MREAPDSKAPWTLLVEDEPRLREQLLTMLSTCAPELAPFRTASSGEEALALCEGHPPRVAFLDIRLPGMSGMDLGIALAGHARLVFVTAYDAFAVQAFEEGAVDYLLKPVSEARVAQCAARLRTLAGPSSATLEQILGALTAPPRTTYLRWITASRGRKTHFVAVDDVFCFKSDSKYTRILCADAEYLIEEPLKQLVPRLDPSQFRQVHRSAVVNLREVLLVERDDVGGGQLSFRRHAETVRISAPFMRELKSFLV
jgi:DNA-binding LytR/AlgR family response regulator